MASVDRWAKMSDKQRDAARARNRKYYRAHPEKMLAKTQERYAREPDKVNARRDKCRDRNREIIRGAKNVPCVDCGIKYHPDVMDFDHVRGVKYKNISTLINGSMEKLLIELDKCDVRCANCHRLRHVLEGVI